jgi:sec-independent protein translocase protein TatA
MITLANIENPTIWIVGLVIVIILFGGQKIPELMRSLGKGKREFERGLRGDDEELMAQQRREDEIRKRVEDEMRKEDEQKRRGVQ